MVTLCLYSFHCGCCDKPVLCSFSHSPLRANVGNTIKKASSESERASFYLDEKLLADVVGTMVVYENAIKKSGGGTLAEHFRGQIECSPKIIEFALYCCSNRRYILQIFDNVAILAKKSCEVNNIDSAALLNDLESSAMSIANKIEEAA
jgi:hypothetical protein